MESHLRSIEVTPSISVEESINSIIVIDSNGEDQSLVPTNSDSLDKQQSQPSDCTELEKKFNELNFKFNECQQENILLKNHCEYLSKKVNESGTALDNGKSILAYDDIEAVCLPGKIEAYFQETNKMFTSSENVFDSMEYLIKSIWSLIAHEYSNQNLNEFKSTRDQLVEKLHQSQHKHKKFNLKSVCQTLSEELSLQVTEGESLKEKVLKQNEILKSLIAQLDLVNTEKQVAVEEQPPVEIPTLPTTSSRIESNEQSDEEENIPSPGSSPSSFFMQRFRKKPAPKPTIPPNDFYLFSLNEDFIAVDKTLDNNLLTLEHEEKTILPGEQALFTCSNCKISIELSATTPSKMQNHMLKCDSQSLVCMFCLELFDKSLQPEYEHHVRCHISLAAE